MRPSRAAVGVVGLAGAYTIANALKPLHVDDPYTFYVARHIVDAPLDPFGLEVFWWQWPQPVFEYLLPPGIAYWGALGFVALGSDPFWWKLSLFPVAALLALSLFSLLKRFAPGLEWPLLVATLLSPLLLPSLNYMPDVPTLALGLGGLVLYLRAEERGSLARAVAAGCVIGLAVQTKYTAFVFVGAVLVRALLWRKWRLGAAAAATALGVFALWELATALRYGQAMFLNNVSSFSLFFGSELRAASLGILSVLGPTLVGIGLLGLAALGLGRRFVLALAVATLLGYGLLLAIPIPIEPALALGGCLAVVTAAALVRLLQSPAPAAPVAAPEASAVARSLAWIEPRRETLFLAAWLLGAVVLCALVSPFPAVRRVIDVALVVTLIIGRAAALSPQRARLPIVPVVALQVGLGLLYYGVDLLEARAQREAVAQTKRAIRAVDPDGPIWFVGHWGFQLYAEQLGMSPVIPDHSRIERGDWLLVPDRVDTPEIAWPPHTLRRVRRIELLDGVPLATLPGFYADLLPLVHHSGPRLTVDVYQARVGMVLESSWELARLVDWAMHAGGSQAGRAAPALARALSRLEDPWARRAVVEALAALGARAAPAAAALQATAAHDPEPAVRAAACRTLRALDPEGAAAACRPQGR